MSDHDGKYGANVDYVYIMSVKHEWYIYLQLTNKRDLCRSGVKVPISDMAPSFTRVQMGFND